jgi:hypothetical protein
VNFATFSEDAQIAVSEAGVEAARLGASAVTPAHLRLAVMRLEYEREREKLREGEPPPDGTFRLPFDDSLRELLEVAAATATVDEPFTRAQLAALLDS